MGRVLDSIAGGLGNTRVCWFTDNQNVVHILQVGSVKPHLQVDNPGSRIGLGGGGGGGGPPPFIWDTRPIQRKHNAASGAALKGCIVNMQTAFLLSGPLCH